MQFCLWIERTRICGTTLSDHRKSNIGFYSSRSKGAAVVSSFCLRCCFQPVIMGLYSGLFLGERFLLSDVFEVTNMSEIIKANPHGCDDGALTDRFGVLIQGLLAIIAFSTLMCKFLFLKSSQTWQYFTLGDRNKAKAKCQSKNTLLRR